MGMPLRAVILGAGYRGRAYADFALAHPEDLSIVGVADPTQAESIPAPAYWADWRECLKNRPAADLVLVTLPDALHHDAAITAFEAGYHVLLEKPISPTEPECREVIAAALKAKKLLMVGHVLRYTAYYAHIKALIDSGELGEVVSITHQESVGFRKMAHSFVRGTWSKAEETSSIILQKCSHDFDLFAWWLEGRLCRKVSSFGSIHHFRPACTPPGAAARCVDCHPSVEKSCVWSAKKMYLETDELKYLFPDSSDEAMKTLIEETDYGCCVYRADNDVPDHQTVMMEFDGGVTVSHVMTGFTAHSVRTTAIALTRGEILGDGNFLKATRFDGQPVETGIPQTLSESNPSRHAGGDFNLMAEVVRLVRNNDESEIRRTTEASLMSHLISFAAEESRQKGGTIVEIRS